MSASKQLPFDFTLKNEFIFDNFLVTIANSELLEILTTPHFFETDFYMIWGSNGMGKSHLLQALCQNIESSVYLPLKKYSSCGPELLSSLEHMKLVCLDDIDCILGNEKWEEALFHFYNSSRNNGQHLVVSAQNSPRNLEVHLNDLGSRLSWGIVYQIQGLNDQEKGRALQLRAKSRGIPLSDEVLNYILLRSSRSMNALFSVLNSLDQLSLAEQRKVTIPFVKQMMKW